MYFQVKCGRFGFYVNVGKAKDITPASTDELLETAQMCIDRSRAILGEDHALHWALHKLSSELGRLRSLEVASVEWARRRGVAR